MNLIAVHLDRKTPEFKPAAQLWQRNRFSSRVYVLSDYHPYPFQDIALELKEAYLSLKDALAKIKVSKSEISLYKDNLEVTKTKYQAGIVSALDLEDSILKYNIANFNQKQAAYDYIIAKVTFEKATGGI